MLVTIVTRDNQTLLLKRQRPFEFWQSVTGSLQHGESHADAARRELFEETGLTDEGVLTYTGVSRQFVIDPRWRDKFVIGAAENVEFEWRYTLEAPIDVQFCDQEHSAVRWLPVESAIETVWSWTNQAALQSLKR